MNDGIVRDTDEDWRQIATQAPYWGVLSAEDFRGIDISPENRARFFATGERFINDVAGFIRTYLKPDFKPERALDFGCGVGRLLIPIARLSRHAVGVDVAPKMLELAAANAASAKLSNISLSVADDGLTRLEGTFDFINTYIVLQHIPPERGYRLISGLLAKLEKGGLASFQLTYAKNRQFFSHEAQRARFYRREGRVLVDLVDTHDERMPGAITMYDYDLNQVFALIGEMAGAPVLTLPTNDDGHLGVHLIFQRAR